ncbi:hydrogenase maturation protease [Symbiobacterium terraclitae]|uniref:Hydrogenase maturation protease n=1 Tax=Symbiobacterium terraclitae TaxID=557451 RepID=A0ABS4JTN6_9FIRM|nr:hydrogenase maturation protease [Symbiobacterium terraclitae]
MPDYEEAPLSLAVRKALRGRVVVVGIGNPGRGDDGAGPRVARLLARQLRPEAPEGPCDRIVAAIAAETTPEAEAGRIAALGPDCVLLVDAVDFGAPPGSSRLFGEEDLTARLGWFAHRPPLALLMRYLQERTGARVVLLGIQPRDVGWSARMTPPVRAASSAVVRRLCRWSEGGASRA